MNAKNWYTVEIIYTSDSETKRFTITNMSADALKQFREQVFFGGAYRRIDADTGEVISPWNIKSLIIMRQECFFNAEQQNKPLANSSSNYKPKTT